MDKTNADRLFEWYQMGCKEGKVQCKECGSTDVEAIRLNPKKLGARGGCEGQLRIMLSCIECKENVIMKYTKRHVDKKIKEESIGDDIPKKTDADRLFAWYLRMCEEGKVKCLVCYSSNVKTIRLNPKRILGVCRECGKLITRKRPLAELRIMTICVDCEEIRINEYTKEQVDEKIMGESIK